MITVEFAKITRGVSKKSNPKFVYKKKRQTNPSKSYIPVHEEKFTLSLFLFLLAVRISSCFKKMASIPPQAS